MDVLWVSEGLVQGVEGAGRKMFIIADSQLLSHRLAAASVMVEELQAFENSFKNWP